MLNKDRTPSSTLSANQQPASGSNSAFISYDGHKPKLDADNKSNTGRFGVKRGKYKTRYTKETGVGRIARSVSPYKRKRKMLMIATKADRCVKKPKVVPTQAPRGIISSGGKCGVVIKPAPSAVSITEMKRKLEIVRLNLEQKNQLHLSSAGNSGGTLPLNYYMKRKLDVAYKQVSTLQSSNLSSLSNNTLKLLG